MAGWIQGSKLFTRAKRVLLVQVEITKGVVNYTVMRFVRPEKKLSEMAEIKKSSAPDVSDWTEDLSDLILIQSARVIVVLNTILYFV